MSVVVSSQKSASGKHYRYARAADRHIVRPATATNWAWPCVGNEVIVKLTFRSLQKCLRRNYFRCWSSTDLEEADKPVEDVEEEVDTVDEIGTLSKHELKPKVVYIYLFCLVQA